MRKPVLVPHGSPVANIICSILLSKEWVVVSVQKVSTRLKRIDVVSAPEWKEYIEEAI